MEVKLYVGNLTKSTTQDELNALFAQAGQVTSVEVIKDRASGKSKGFAFVTMSAKREAEKAISMFNSYSLGDRVLEVNIARPRMAGGSTTGAPPPESKEKKKRRGRNS